MFKHAARLALLLLTVSCAKTLPQRIARISPPPLPQSLGLSLSNVAPGGTQGLAHLTYSVTTPAGGQTMQLTDPKHPIGAKVQLEPCTLRIKPFVCKPRVGQPSLNSCKVEGCYTLCVRDPSGLHYGDFEVNPWGALVLKQGTPARSISVELVSTSERSMYFFYRKGLAGPNSELLMALEYRQASKLTERQLDASDGWGYRFYSPDGQLSVYPPQALTGLPEALRGQASRELQQAVDANDAYGKNSWGSGSDPSKRVYGADAMPGQHHYCTGGG